MILPPERLPVIVGIGEITDRPADPANGLEPLSLMEEALRRAETDAGAGLLARLDSLDIVNQVTWPYADMPAQLAARLGASPAHAYYGPVGGESPIRYLHLAAARIARGEADIAAICGAESQSTLTKAKRANIALPWTPKPAKFDPPLRGVDFLHAAAVNLGVFLPVTVYPFYENATAAAWRQTPAQATAETGRLWSRYAAVAAENPYAWLKRAYAPAEITTPTADNRLIAWPYTKLMVANPNVNQGAALILTSLSTARAAGIPEDRCIFIHGGAFANEPRDYLNRDHYHGSTAQDAVLHSAARIAGEGGFTATELYSCFPCVPKMAGRTLGLGPDAVPTVTGGLTFFGAPLNTYMTNAACAMTRRLRAEGGTGLLYGQGEYVTKHHAIVVSARPPGNGALLDAASVQAEADARRGPVPPFVTDAKGAATLETFTVIYDRDGAASHGVAIARMEGGARVLARVPGEAQDEIARLTDLRQTPVGAAGRISRLGDELHWNFG
jgi:acetyl-CoA acetyltransferase